LRITFIGFDWIRFIIPTNSIFCIFQFFSRAHRHSADG
jgi:hypothetical protein